MEGEHTIIGRIPRERLNQIASRKLSALGITVRLSADRESLEGDMAFSGRLVHPTTSAPIPRARFAVLGHDRLAFLDPPLAALGPFTFADHERAITLEAAVAAALSVRHLAVEEIAARMRALRLAVTIDSERMSVRAVVKTPSHAFEILGGPKEIRVSRVAPVGGQPFEVPAAFPPLDLGRYPSAMDLELYLVGAVTEMEAEADLPSARSSSGAQSTTGVVATPPPRNALTLRALADAFGEDAMVAPNATVELVEEFEYGGTRYRFVASREVGSHFRGRVIGPKGDVWADRFELGSFPGTRRVVSVALGVGLSDLDAPNAPVQSTEDTLSHLLPHAGELWVMSVFVEEMGKDEVRYVGTDIDGRPYGAARVLKRSDFEAVFTAERGGWRLFVLIDQVKEGDIVYRQLDRQRQPFGASRKMAAAILMANFVPEALLF